MNKFLILSPLNSVSYKEIFKKFIDSKMWPGYIFNRSIEFIIPSNSSKFKREENGNKYASVSIMWWTNLDRKPNKPLDLTKEFNQKDYPVYDNYLAFEVSKVKDIPKNEYIEIEIDPKDYSKWKTVYGDDLEIIEDDENKNT